MDRNNFLRNPNGRVSGIRPPSSYKPKLGAQNNHMYRRPSGVIPMMSLSTQSRKGKGPLSTVTSYNNNAPGSGGYSRVSDFTGRLSTFGNIPKLTFSSARKSISLQNVNQNVTSKISIYGMTPQNKRPSFQFGTCSSSQSSRRGSSIGGTRNRADDRPLTDGTYHRKCATKLLNWLVENEYPYKIERLHTHPSNTDVKNISEFLFQRIFNCKIKVLPIEIEVPKLLQILEYPYSVKKSDLTSFTSGRSLGSLLGMFEWIIDSISYSDKMSPQRMMFQDFEGSIDVNGELIQICMTDLENENEFAQVNDQTIGQLQDLAIKKYGTESDYMKRIDEQEKLEMEAQQLEDKINEIKDYPKMIQNHRESIETYKKYIIDLKTNIDENQRSLKELSEELHQKESQLKDLLVNVNMTRGLVNAQDFGIDDAVLAKDRKLQLEEELRKESVVIEELKRNIRTSKNECNKVSDNLNKLFSDALSYIIAMRELIDSPLMINYVDSLKKVFCNDPSWDEISNILHYIQKNGFSITDKTENFGHRFSSNISDLKMAIVAQLSSLKGTRTLTEQQKITDLESVTKDLETRIDHSQTQVNALMKECNAKRKEQTDQLNNLKTENDRFTQMIAELESNEKKFLKEAKDNIRELKRKLNDAKINNNTDIKALMEQIKEHISSEENHLNAINEKIDQKLKGLKQTNTKLKEIKRKYINARVTKDRGAKRK